MKEENNKNESGSKRVVLTAVVFFLIGFGAAWMFAKPAEAPTSEVKDEVVETKIPSMGSNAIEVDDQKIGMTVSLKSVKFESAGWVAIHDDNGGTPGNILGAAWFPSGENSGAVELLRSTESGKTYFAMLHNDDGDKKFDHKIDVPLTDASSTIIMVKFMASDTPAVQ
ncbi:MAG: hypothetical protein LiPW41_211 [Parcubacteria group bacterium LiPW_41]|nr:MAG: hypothetical protein LiPW41_211 [Parcubacteria group bacterium LiPW_41]